MSQVNARPLVTLALFAYNQEAYVSQAVESALNQDYSPLEVIISDDHSSDSTFSLIEQIVSAYDGPHTVRTNCMPANVGLASHLNHVFDMARGQIIVVAAGDDICFPNKVSSLVAPMMADDSIVGVHSGVIEIDVHGEVFGESHLDNPEELALPSQVISGSLSVVAQSHAFRKRVHELFGSFDPTVTNEGKVMAFRESMVGKIIYLHEPLTFYRVGSGVSTSRSIDTDVLTLIEPKKIASWNYTAIMQIESDFRKLGCSDKSLGMLISARHRYLRSIFNINANRFAFRELCALIFESRQFIAGAKAFLRVNSPKFIRAAYSRFVLGKM